MTHYTITYMDEDGKELDHVEIYKGCPIFEDDGEYFWFDDSGNPVFWSCLSHARGGLGSYQAHEHTRKWLDHVEGAGVMQ